MRNFCFRVLKYTTACCALVICHMGTAGEVPVAIDQTGVSTRYVQASADDRSIDVPFQHDGQIVAWAPETAFGAHPRLSCCGVLARPPSWGQLDFLLWWRSPYHLPPLVTSSPVGTPVDQAGQLNQPTTTRLLGGHSLANGPNAGGRIDFGYWLDTHQQLGIGGSFLALGQSHLEFATDSSTHAILTRPFNNVSAGQAPLADALLIAFPDESTGRVDVRGSSRLMVAEGYLRQSWYDDVVTNIDLVAGYQFSRIDESLLITSQSTISSTSNLRPPGTTLDVRDSFVTRNEFHGGLIGFLTDWRFHCLTVTGSVKVGLGNMRQRAAISGQTVIGDSVTSFTDPQGLLARNTNHGSHQRNVFTVVPQFGLRSAYAVSDGFDVTLGYSLILWSHVLQPANQIDSDLAVNLSDPLSGESRPEFTFKSNDYWVQGMTLGVRWSY